jgi:hypothetical protein
MATSILNSENPFTNEVHNAVRISLIVVDVAGEILRKKLEEIILNKNGSMSKIRCVTNSYNNVKEYFEKNQNIFKDNSEFYADQINAMYPKNIPTSNIVNNEKFDITLCTHILSWLVIKPLSGWSSKHEPQQNDTSFGANIVRIRLIRNINWAHVHKFGMKDNEMKRFNKNDNSLSLLAKLESAIYSLCKDSNEIKDYKDKIDKCCSCEIDEKKISTYKNKIANLVAKDLEFHEFLIKEIGENGKISQVIINLINENNINDMKNFDRIKNLQQSLLQKLGDKFKIILKRDEFKEEINILRNDLVGQGKQIISNISEVSNEISQVKDLLIQPNEIKNCKNINIADFKGYFDEEFSRFKILILDYEELNLEDDEKQKLINSIAFSKWNIIIDLNLNRSNTGIDKNICEVYEKKLKINFLKKKIEEKASITESDKYFIATNTLLCYFFLSEIDNFDEEFQMFLKELNLTQKPIMCTNLFLRKDYKTDYLDEIEGINKAVKSAVYQTNKTEILDLIYVFIDNNVKYQETQSSFGRKINNVEKKIFESTFLKFISDMAPNMDLKEITKQFLPSRNGQKMEWDEKYNSYSAFIEVYHINIGKIFHKIFCFLKIN